ncbi:Arginine permease CAN1 [Fulvia fulva]|uniref:Arginine permease CAN1 n=1 Tax=Passalora fulva TaxID=5499 RepID=A0A9Q8LCD5_PASFU|nr:Arginine permease CAN1 [Fulvia fulva]KAK4629570.1 Arginine permease CAN1 [Fulvia fulva]KAK4629877.1 Arginine permease CAN1 [Fulvia fulva]UJO14817.1 Arginine permease CAN1 [Fulvia fulva]WPV12700.1 Arginine permease CAN1 [Fulvia fulva]WPV27036.1 Arginine permease CAN1 [Fulvia fulva]
MADHIKSEDAIFGAGPNEKKTTYDVHSTSGSSDVEKQDDSIRAGTTVQLKRKLQSRHLQMIAIGGTIGTGLFIGSGSALATAGPAGALIAYAFIGTLVYSVMVALGEMATYIPISGAFTVYAARFVDPALGFAMGWIYWFSWAITYALELTACGLIIQYWAPELNVGIFIGVFWLVITAINFLPVSFYGEVEFWFASIKVLTVIGFLIFAICIDAGAGQQGYLGFKYWHHPGAFTPYNAVWTDQALAKFVSFWSVLIQAGFSYQGTELVGIAAGETANPRKTVPAAIKKTFYRILFFFVFTVIFIGLLVPSDNEQLLSGNTDASASPMVIAAKLAGVKVLPGLINAVLLCVVLSAANANVYSGSRILVGLAEERSAPSWFKLTTNGGVPYVGVAFTAAFGLLGFLNESTDGGKVFDWLLNITSIAGFISWTCINICHIAFMRALKARGQSRDTLPYKAFWQPWFSWYGLFFNVLIIVTNGFTAFIPWNTSDFFVAYISVIIFFVMYFGYKLVYRTKFVKPIDADLDTGRKEIEEMYFEQVVPTTLWGKFWVWMG